MLNRREIDEALKQYPEYQKLLFGKGFLITDEDLRSNNQYPFNSDIWAVEIIGAEVNNPFYVWHDKRVDFFSIISNGQTLFMIGHAYNPIEMITDENVILQNMSELEGHEFWEYESHLTGIYVMGILDVNTLKHWGDCTCMRLSYYGIVNGHYYISSHALLVGDLLGLQEDPYITRLKNYKHFHYFGNILPGDLSPYIEFKKTVPNHFFIYNCVSKTVEFARFFPFKAIIECKTEEEYQSIVNKVALIMKHTMHAIIIKWDKLRVAISITGGRDSAISLASAKDDYDQYYFFSYNSSPEELVDAKAARQICDAIGLKHDIYEIPYSDDVFPNIELLRAILSYNGGNIIDLNKHNVRTRAFFLENPKFDVEVKSWVDEVGRAMPCKRFNKKRMPKKMTARACTTMYKVFTLDRKLVKETDLVFESFTSKYLMSCSPSWWEGFHWEYRWGTMEPNHMVNEHMIAYEVTVPFNNRELCALLLKPSLHDKINDRLQQDIVKVNNSAISDININVVDANHTKVRSYVEKAYFEINTRLPF